jgi:YD repeat-containing protein
MFDWLGTFNRSQFQRLTTYTRSQLTYIKSRIGHLTTEKQRIGFLQFTYDSAGQPTGYATGQPGVRTFIGKLMSAYEVLGGDPFYDLQVRSTSNPVFYTKGTETYSAKVLSNGEPVPSLGLADAVSGNAVRSIRGWVSENLDRLERIERKVRRAIDYSDQLQLEIDNLNSITNAVEVEGSLENLITLVNQLFTDPSYRAIADDKGKDPFGKVAYAPMSSYDQGGTRAPSEGLVIERGSAGYTTSGGGSS